jgi:hypothetical protein
MKLLTAKKASLVLGALLVFPLLTACGSMRAELQGRQLGDAICSLKSASPGEVQAKADKVQREANDVQRIVGRPVQTDVKDYTQNMADLVRHVQGGNTALARQDVRALDRNFEAVARTLNGKGRAAYDGVREGIADCT